jgi:hypothetical protein
MPQNKGSKILFLLSAKKFTNLLLSLYQTVGYKSKGVKSSLFTAQMNTGGAEGMAPLSGTARFPGAQDK